MPQDYFPSGPFLRELPDAEAFDIAREDFLLEFANIRTARAYKADLEDFREWCTTAGTRPLHVSASELERYVSSLIERGYAAGTVERRVAALRGFFHHLVSAGLVARSPAKELQKLRGRPSP